MECPDCGHQNIEGDDFCAGCGRALTTPDTPPSDDPVEIRIMKSRISELKPTAPCQVAPDTPLKEAVHTLVEKSIGCVLIVEDGKLVGIFSERDLLLRIGRQYKQLESEPIRNFMTPKPVSLYADDSIAFALNRMDAGGCRHIPICERDNDRLTGIVSVRDIMGYLVSHAHDE